VTSVGQTSTGTSVVTSSDRQYCEAACSFIQGCLGIGDCVSHCHASTGNCGAEQDQFLSCILEQSSAPGTCELPPGCTAPLFSFLSCRGAVVQEGACMVDGLGNCTCQQYDQQMNFIEVNCEVQPGGSKCRCGFNGESVGQCTSPNTTACDAMSDCCGTVFYVPGYP
jgi:hypothetical protein